jgi:putative transposase
MLKQHTQAPEEQAGEMRLSLDELAREGARRMLAAALEAEVAEYLERHRGERDEQGQALVVKNGRARARKITLGAGTVEISSPRINDPSLARERTSRSQPVRSYCRATARSARSTSSRYAVARPTCTSASIGAFCSRRSSAL